MGRLAPLHRALFRRFSAVRPQVAALAVLVQDLGFQIDVLAVAGENVVQTRGHIQDHRSRLEVLARVRIGVVDLRLVHQNAGCRIEDDQSQAAINKGVPPGDRVETTVFDQHVSADWPERFDLVVCNQTTIARCGQVTPSEFAVRGAKAINPAISRAEVDTSLAHGRRRIDPAASHVAPLRLTVLL